MTNSTHGDRFQTIGDRIAVVVVLAPFAIFVAFMGWYIATH